MCVGDLHMYLKCVFDYKVNFINLTGNFTYLNLSGDFVNLPRYEKPLLQWGFTFGGFGIGLYS